LGLAKLRNMQQENWSLLCPCRTPCLVMGSTCPVNWAWACRTVPWDVAGGGAPWVERWAALPSVRLSTTTMWSVRIKASSDTNLHALDLKWMV
jgi:hypothetical protein